MNDKEIRRFLRDLSIKPLDNNKGYYARTKKITGKEIKRTGKTKQEVRDKFEALLTNVSNGYKNPEKIRLNDYIETWLDRWKKPYLQPTSYERLESIYIHQIKDTIGNRMIGDISTDDIQNLINEYANPSKVDGKALSRSGLKKLRQLLMSCYNQAVKDDVLQINPCKDVIIPNECNILVKEKEQISLSDPEITSLKTACLSRYSSTGEYKARNGLIILLFLNLGLRCGEMLALKWDDINLEDETISIHSSLQVSKSKGKIIKTTKTKNGVRILSISEATFFYLNELREYDKRHGIVSQYVCCTNKGTLENQRNLTRSLDRILKWTTIDSKKKVSLHILRHTFGSTMLRRGVPIATVSKLMGHANINITYSKYIHTIQELDAMAMKMESIA